MRESVKNFFASYSFWSWVWLAGAVIGVIFNWKDVFVMGALILSAVYGVGGALERKLDGYARIFATELDRRR